MTMFALLFASVLCDVGGQVCFKLGLNGGTDSAESGIAGFVRGIVRSPWIALGVIVYALEFVAWYAALTIAPLSLAMPFAALSYCGIVVASRWILKEHVSRRRWAATLVVAVGVAIVCLPGAA
jgi:drug/metabolite transporter (DMT)-like permease